MVNRMVEITFIGKISTEFSLGLSSFLISLFISLLSFTDCQTEKNTYDTGPNY
jgi:hypothetical protein